MALKKYKSVFSEAKKTGISNISFENIGGELSIQFDPYISHADNNWYETRKGEVTVSIQFSSSLPKEFAINTGLTPGMDKSPFNVTATKKDLQNEFLKICEEFDNKILIAIAKASGVSPSKIRKIN